MGEIRITAHQRITGDCGHEFEVSVVGVDTETDLVCPTCGAIDHFNVDQIAKIESDLAVLAPKAALDYVAGELDTSLRKAFRGSKNITYTSKRRR